MVRLAGPLSRLNRKKVMVAGDLFLDSYTIGKARRISPEAPVAVIHVTHEEHRPGGAGNVILNLVSLGAEIVALGRIGADHAGRLLQRSLVDEGVHINGVVMQDDYQTPLKNRIIAENQQIVRIDHEKIDQLPFDVEEKIVALLPELLKGVDLLAISDYGKGFLTKTLLSSLIAAANELDIPIIADPKGIDFSRYRGATIIKPNLGEAFAAANMATDAPLERVAEKILEITDAQILMVTRAEAGISLFGNDSSRHDFPVRVREVKDVTGAGDTVLAVLACAVANGLEMHEAVPLSNLAAGIAIERFGCARVSLQDLARRLLEEDVANKVFDEEHLFTLQEALKGHRFNLLAVSSTEGFTPQLFSAVRQVGAEEKADLIVYVRESDASNEFIDVLASIRDVDFILLKSENLRQIATRIKPEQIYSLVDGKLQKVDNLKDLL